MAMWIAQDKLGSWRMDDVTRSDTLFLPTRFGLTGSEAYRTRLVVCPTRATVIPRIGRSGGKAAINAHCIETKDVFALEVRRYNGLKDMPPGVLP